ncbi:hybrid sensor histidine kinase/response regulator [Serratia bockelmannii]|uniref:histidine kinase n=1 Tax=Serratia bockelmannii TaxID=2703793 RepID=A0ABT8LX99_9GAMM|nr:hybrid sensor histidine kinase/response regulator [Serratia bockelmannii]MDN6881931.1 hybrid sensor histidine kinase/response regulator [Serratia bockelmannii]HBH6890284.1 response regulator [Serratia marcescens]
MKMKRIITQYVAVLLLLSSAFFWMYDRYFSTMHNMNSAGPQENYAWAIAKFSIRLAAFGAKTERHLRLNIKDKKNLQQDLDLLFSSSNVLLNKSMSTRYLYEEKGYSESINGINKILNKIDVELSSDTTDFEKILIDIDKIGEENKTLMAISDHAEVRQRTILHDDYLNKWNSIKFPIITLYLVLMVMVSLSFRQLILINKQLDSEKKSFNNKNAFLGKLGHELRTSLQAIVGSIELIINSKEKKVSDFIIRRLENAAVQIEHQMSDLSEYAKIDNGAIKINHYDFNIETLVTSIVSECNSKYQSERLKAVVTECPNTFIKSDSARISQIMENLITNAFKYTERGAITVSCKISKISKSTNLTITIEDTGIGIPKDKFETIFQPFVRVETPSSGVPGSGMGLAIVDGVIKAMSGSINIKSELGVGTRFIVQLPVEESGLDINEIVLSDSTNETLHKGINILFIDDNQLTCSVMTSTLNSCGYRGESISSVNRAIEKLMRKPYDIILSDLQMPMMNGDQLLEHIRKEYGPNKNTPFIFITAYSNESEINGAPLLTKPVRISEINNQINKVLGKQQED